MCRFVLFFCKKSKNLENQKKLNSVDLKGAQNFLAIKQSKARNRRDNKGKGGDCHDLERQLLPS